MCKTHIFLICVHCQCAKLINFLICVYCQPAITTNQAVNDESRLQQMNELDEIKALDLSISRLLFENKLNDLCYSCFNKKNRCSIKHPHKTNDKLEL